MTRMAQPSPFDDDYAVQQHSLIQQLKLAFAEGSQQVSIVDMRQDYEQDAEMALTAVTFPAPELAAQIADQIIAPLRTIEPDHFYYSNDLLHLTIKNIRKMHQPPRFTAADAQAVHQQFQHIIPTFPGFSMQLTGVMQLPTSVALLAYSSRILGDLIQALDRGLAEIGLPDDKQYISNTVFFSFQILI